MWRIHQNGNAGANRSHRILYKEYKRLEISFFFFFEFRIENFLIRIFIYFERFGDIDICVKYAKKKNGNLIR